MGKVISNDSKPLYGLLLIGGKSTRMKQDKSLIEYHGLPQKDYLFSMMSNYCDEVYFSGRSEQNSSSNANQFIVDSQINVTGPFNGLLSAHQKFPKASWLILACDLPLVTQESIDYLLKNRNQNAMATAYAKKNSNLPEPMFSIWEAKAFNQILEFMESFQSRCPRKYLLQQNIQLIYPKDDTILLNANKPEDREFVSKILNNS